MEEGGGQGSQALGGCEGMEAFGFRDSRETGFRVEVE